MIPFGKALGAQFEISVDGKPRSYHDRKAVAIEAAEYLKWKHPHSEVVMKDRGTYARGSGREDYKNSAGTGNSWY